MPEPEKADEPELTITISEDLSPGQKLVANKLAEIYATTGLFVAGRDVYDGMVLMKTAGQRADEVVRWARNDKRIWKILVRLVNSSDLFSMVSGHAMMCYAILSHHRGNGNQTLLASLGYSEAQILAPPPGMNGSMPDGASPPNFASTNAGA